DRDRVERVEEKVGIELRLERGEARARQLLGQPRQLQLTLARLDEVPDGVLDPDDGQVDRDAERERDEQPADEVAQRAFFERLRREKRLQDGSGARPRRAEQQRERKV